MAKIILTATTNPVRVTGRARWVSNLLIWSNGSPVAHAKLAGKFDAEQALREFRANPQRFTLTPRFAALTPDQIRSLAA